MHSDANASEPEQRRDVSATEPMLSALWCEVLQCTTAPKATDNFMSLGGDSMAIVLLEYRIKEEFRIDLPTGVVLIKPTLHELAVAIDARLATAQPVESHAMADGENHFIDTERSPEISQSNPTAMIDSAQQPHPVVKSV